MRTENYGVVVIILLSIIGLIVVIFYPFNDMSNDLKKEFCKSMNMRFSEHSIGKFDCIDEKGEIHTFDKKVLRGK